MPHQLRPVWKRTFSLSSILWLALAIACFLAGRFGHWESLPREVSNIRLSVPVGETITYEASLPFSTYRVAAAMQKPFGAQPVSQTELKIAGIAEGGGAVILRDSETYLEVLAIDVVPRQTSPARAPPSASADPSEATGQDDAERDESPAFKRLVQKAPKKPTYLWFNLSEYVGANASEDEQWMARVILEMKNSILQNRWVENGGPVAAQLVSGTELIVAGGEQDRKIIRAYWEGRRDASATANESSRIPTAD